MMEAIKLGLEIAKLAPDAIAFFRGAVPKARQLTSRQLRRIAFDEALAALDRAIMQERYAPTRE